MRGRKEKERERGREKDYEREERERERERELYSPSGSALISFLRIFKCVSDIMSEMAEGRSVKSLQLTS